VDAGLTIATHLAMALWFRLLMWIVVLIVPGGLLLLPVLVGDAWKRRKAATKRAPMSRHSTEINVAH